MTLYLLNSLAVSIDYSRYPTATVKFRRVTVEEARAIVREAAARGELVSAIGHESTARLLSELFGVEVPVNRASIWFNPGDQGIHFYVPTRLPEGRVLSLEELQKLGYWLIHSQVL